MVARPASGVRPSVTTNATIFISASLSVDVADDRAFTSRLHALIDLLVVAGHGAPPFGLVLALTTRRRTRTAKMDTLLVQPDSERLGSCVTPLLPAAV